MAKTAFATALERDAPLVIDGGLATELEAQGCDISNPLWSASLLLDHPETIAAASRAFLEAGAECIATASYQASREGFAGRGLSSTQATQLMSLSVDLATRARDEFLAANRDTSFAPLVAASIGPYGAMLHDGSEYRGDYGVSADALRAFHAGRLRVFDTSAADVLACETIPSLLEAQVLAELLTDCATPAWVSYSCRDARHISDGTRIEDAVKVFRHHPVVIAVGLNCSAPQHVVELIRRIRSALPQTAVVAYPNSGEAWDAQRGAWVSTAAPLDFAAAACDWVDAGARIVGGCCRIGPAHIRAMHRALTGDVRQGRGQ